MGCNPVLDIIIVNYNSTDCLIRCLESVFREITHGKVNVFVADNNSTDQVNRITARFPNVHLIQNKKNLGFAVAVNQCIQKSSAPYFMLLNPDTLVGAGFFEFIIDYMEKTPDVGILGPVIYDQHLKVQGSARAFPTPVTALFGRSSILTRVFPNNRVTRKNILNQMSDGKTPMPVDWVSGACMLVRRKAAEQTGLLDENFFMYWEDADWCRRMAEKGWKVLYYPKAWVMHYTGVSSEQNLTRSVIEFHKSAYYLFNKYARTSFGLIKIIVISGLVARAGFLVALHFVRRRGIIKNG